MFVVIKLSQPQRSKAGIFLVIQPERFETTMVLNVLEVPVFEEHLVRNYCHQISTKKCCTWFLRKYPTTIHLMSFQHLLHPQSKFQTGQPKWRRDKQQANILRKPSLNASYGRGNLRMLLCLLSMFYYKCLSIFQSPKQRQPQNEIMKFTS